MAWINLLRLNKPDRKLPEFRTPETSAANAGPKTRLPGTALLKKPDTKPFSRVAPLAELKKPDILPLMSESLAVLKKPELS